MSLDGGQKLPGLHEVAQHGTSPGCLPCTCTVVTSHTASQEPVCFLETKSRGVVVRRYLWGLQLSSQEGIMHTVLLPLHRGRTGPTCPPATLLLLVTAPGLGETITACRFSNFNLWVVSSARVAKLCTSYNAAAGRVFGSNLGCMKYHRHVASIKSRCGLDHLGSRYVVCWTSIVLCVGPALCCVLDQHCVVFVLCSCVQYCRKLFIQRRLSHLQAEMLAVSHFFHGSKHLTKLASY